MSKAWQKMEGSIVAKAKSSPDNNSSSTTDETNAAAAFNANTDANTKNTEPQVSKSLAAKDSDEIPVKPLSEKTLTQLKSSVTSRSFSMAKLGLQAGLGYLNHKMKKKEDQGESWKLFLTEQSKILGNELGELKGSLMKAGQMLSIYGEYFLPEEANLFLKKLQSESPAVDWPVIQKNLKNYLAPKILDELEVQTKALACASMGQVHRAKIKSSGDEIVLKIQYPNVDKAIASDLKALKTVLGVLNLLPKDFNSDPLFDEVRTMLEQEVRYEQEAELTKEYSTLLSEDSRYLVPTVWPRYSNSKVLATTFMPGVRADDSLIQNLPQARRNRLGENFLELYFKEVFEWRLVQTDPHLGNYKIKLEPNGQDKLVLLDFGATRRFTAEFMKIYKELIRAAYKDDRESFYQASYQLGFLAPTDPIELKQAFEDFCFLTLEPFKVQEGLYNWKNNDLPQRLSDKAMHIVKNFAWRTPPHEIIFLDRKTGGVFIFLAVLRCEFDARKILEKFLT